MDLSLPPNLRPPVERAVAQAEAAFREGIDWQNTQNWLAVRVSVLEAMTVGFRPFSTQALLAVREKQWTVMESRKEASEFLEALAANVYDWLLPLSTNVCWSPYSFDRDNKRDSRFRFCRDMAEAVKSSKEWMQFLGSIAAVEPDDAANKPADQEVPTQPKTSVNPSGAEAVRASDPSVASYPGRAAWVREQMGIREMTPYRVRTVGGPDPKTVERILDGRPVGDQILYKLAKALSHDGQAVSYKDIPQD